jgi:uncharacterized membrane protein YoaK (UPF0700 family)
LTEDLSEKNLHSKAVHAHADKLRVNEFWGSPFLAARKRLLAFSEFPRNLLLASSLAVVAGVVNSVGFLAFGTFVSHVSGHATRAAVEYSEGHWRLGTAFFLATLYFISGALFTTIVTSAQSIETRTKRFNIPLAVEFVLILVVMFRSIQMSSPMTGISSSQVPNFIYILSFLMGLQNALIRNASGTIVRTTHMTGVATDIGIAIGTAFLSFFNETKKEFQKSIGVLTEVRRSFRCKAKAIFSLFANTTRSFIRMFRYERLLLHVSVLLSFLLGAILGTVGFINYFFYILIFPACIIAVIMLKELFFFKHHRIKSKSNTAG